MVSPTIGFQSTCTKISFQTKIHFANHISPTQEKETKTKQSYIVKATLNFVLILVLYFQNFCLNFLLLQSKILIGTRNALKYTCNRLVV